MAEQSLPARELASELAQRLAQRYRIDEFEATELILELWAKDHVLAKTLIDEPDAVRVKRTRAYKEAENRAKSHVYNHLRRYKLDEQRLLQATEVLSRMPPGAFSDPNAISARNSITSAHISTRERLQDLDDFFAQVFGFVPKPETVLDIGSGVQPLLYPFDTQGRSTARYLALDKDKGCVDAVNAWSHVLGGNRLMAQRWQLADGFDGVEAPPGGFSLALALKFVPVIGRQERGQLSKLRGVPARNLLITGASQGMVKRRSIERREEQSLRDFAEDNDFAIVCQLKTSSELGFFLEAKTPAGHRD